MFFFVWLKWKKIYLISRIIEKKIKLIFVVIFINFIMYRIKYINKVRIINEIGLGI